MQVQWEYLTPVEFKKMAHDEQICLVPFGSLERHGNHLPYGADGLVAHAIACRAAELEPCVVFPTYWFGQVHEAAAFTGAINFPARLLLEMFETLLDQIAHNGFKKIVILNRHGGNDHFLDYFAMSQMDREVDYTLYILRGIGPRLTDYYETHGIHGDHAGGTETSNVMAVVPDGVVKMEQQNYPEPILPKINLAQELPGVHSGLWWYALYPENVTEVPSDASKEKGEAIIEASAQDVAETLRAIKKDTLITSLQQEYYTRVRGVRNCE